MQTAAVLVTSVLLAAGAAAGISYSMMPPAARAAATDPAIGEVQARIATLEGEIETLRAAAKQVAPERRAVDPVTNAQIDAAVARYLKAHPVDAAAAKDPAGKGQKRNLNQTLLHLQGDLSEKEFNAVWAELRESGQVDEMVKLIEAHAANNPRDADAQVHVGLAYLMKVQGMTPGIESGELANKADKTFDRVLEMDPNHWDARFVKAQALSFWPPMFGKQAEAIRNLETLRGQQESGAKREPKFAQTYLMLGNLYSQQGKMDQAKAAWQKGAELFPDNSELKTKSSGDK